jgi:hypothetical protein
MTLHHLTLPVVAGVALVMLLPCAATPALSQVAAGATAPAPPAAPAPTVAPSPQPASPTRDSMATDQLRYQMRVLEGVLENAVQHGAQLVNAQIREFSPDVMLFSGPARARGFRLEGYGVFFSVEVPRVRGSMAWSVRTLTRNNQDVRRAVQQLRRFVQASTTSDPRVRRDLESALRLVEAQAGPTPPGIPRSPAPPGDLMSPASAGTPPQAETIETEAAFDPPPILTEPDAVYEGEVKRALIDAMLDHGTPLGLASGEWLTIAAREHEDSLLTGEVVSTITITLRLRGRDLAAFKAGQITRDDARVRVEITEF